MSKPIYFSEGIYDECIPSDEDRARIADIESRHIDATIGEWSNYFSFGDADLMKVLHPTRKRKRA